MAGLPADAAIQWGELELGKRIRDYIISRERTYEDTVLRWDVDPGWMIEDDINESPVRIALMAAYGGAC